MGFLLHLLIVSHGTCVCKLHWLSDLGDWGTRLLDGSCKSWGTECVDKLLLGACWQHVFIVGAS